MIKYYLYYLIDLFRSYCLIIILTFFLLLRISCIYDWNIGRNLLLFWNNLNVCFVGLVCLIRLVFFSFFGQIGCHTIWSLCVFQGLLFWTFLFFLIKCSKIHLFCFRFRTRLHNFRTCFRVESICYYQSFLIFH